MAAPDLSGVPEADLQAMASGNMSAVSEPTLRYLAGLPQQPVAMPAPLPNENYGHAALGAVNSLIDSLGHAIAVPGYPEQNAEALADYVTGHVLGKTPADVQQESNANEAQFPTSAKAGNLAGHALEAYAGSELGAGAGKGLELGAGTGPAVLRGALTGATAGAAGAPTHPLAGAAGGAALGGITQPLLEPTAVAAANAATPWYQAGFRNAEGNPLARNVAAGSGKDALVLRNQQAGNTMLANEAGVTLPTQNGVDIEGPFIAGREAPNSVYNRAAAGITPHVLADDPVLVQAIRNAGSGEGRISAGTPQSAEMIARIQTQLLDPNRVTTGNELINEVRGLRQEGFRNAGSEDVSNQHLGQAQLDMAHALEDHAGAQFPEGGPVSLEQLQQARTALAKNYAVQGAMRGRNVDLGAIARMQRASPDLLTGGMKVAADFANDNPTVVGLGSRIYQPPSYTEDVMGLRGTHNPETFLSPSYWAGLAGLKALARRVLAGPGGQGAEQAGAAFPPRGNAPFAPLPPGASPAGTIPFEPPGAAPPLSAGPMGAPPAPGGAGAPFSLADVLSQGVEHEPPAGLSSGPMGAPPAGGLPFRVPPESVAGGLELAPEAQGAAQPRYTQLGDVMSQGVPEGIVQRSTPPYVPRLSDVLANNASGESAGSQEAVNALAQMKAAGVQRLRLDPDGEPTPLPGLEARDPSSIKGHPVIEIGPDGPKIVDRGGMSPAAVRGLIARFMSRQQLGSAF